MNEETVIKSTEFPKDTIVVAPNRRERSENSVFIQVVNKGEGIFRDESISIEGKEEIIDLLKAIAYHGGLLNEGGRLTLYMEKVLPENGMYLLHEGEHKSIAYVKDGKLLIPQVNLDYTAVTGKMRDCTKVYLNDPELTLSPMEVVP